ncbi:DUF302 domain-containing protein [Haladaptatus sp. NG-WS-4]
MPTDPTHDRRTMLRLASTLLGGSLLAAPAGANQETTTQTTGTETGEENGLVTVESEQDFDETVGRIEADIENIEALTLLTTVDHAENAQSVGLDLPPTTLLIFGNPQVGTPLMQASRTIGIDLPQKMLVWQDGETVNVTYNDPQYLADRHGIEGRRQQLRAIAEVLRALAEGRTGGGSN